MSTFRVPLVRIGKVGKHPNADTLSITEVEGCPCIFRTGDFVEGDLAIYIPVDAVVPPGVPGTEFLGDKRRIKAKRLRGIFSMGILLRAPTPNEAILTIPMTTQVGDDVSFCFGITKYEEPEPVAFRGENVKAPSGINVPHYDVESYRKYKYVFEPNEQVVVTEKIHGTNSRFVWHDDKLYIGSHTCWKDPNGNTVWARVAKQYDLASKLSRFPGFQGLIFYGETYGQVQDLRYGTGKGELKLAFFDIFDPFKGRYLDYVDFRAVIDTLGLDNVPVLYSGPYSEEIDEFRDGLSTASTVPQIREGFVIKPTHERWHPELGRVIAKMLGEEYLTRKGGTEYH